MDTIESTLRALKASIAKIKAKERKRFEDAAGQVDSHMVLLKLSTLSPQVGQKLASLLRGSLAVLYKGLDVHALRLTAAIFEYTYHNRILSAISSSQYEQKDLWEAVLYGMLSGVLDYLDTNDTKESKDAVGATLYPVLSDICFSLSAPRTGVDIRCSAYNVMIDASASHQGNQDRLRDPDILGGGRLGACIWRTKDYLAQESLLNLFARILPSTNKSATGRAKRTAFIHSVFVETAPPEVISIGKNIADILEHVPSSDWDATSVRIVDVIAQGSISFPQPFAVKEVVIDGTAYPSDRLYADDKTLLANVLLDDDQYESLEIAYSTVISLRTDSAFQDCADVNLALQRAPRLGRDLMKTGGEDVVNATFSLRAHDQPRFFEVLANRGMHSLLPDRSQISSKAKSSIAVEPANLELDDAGHLVEPSQSERIVAVSQFYGTEDASDDIQSAGDSDEPVIGGDAKSESIHVPEANAGKKKNDSTTPLVLLGTFDGSVHPSPEAAPQFLARTGSQIIRDAIFGAPDEELSDISDCDSPGTKSRILRRTSASLSGSLVRGRLSFEPASKKESAPRLTRGRVGNVILDSDEESGPPVPPRGRPRTTKKALLREPTAENVDEPALSLPFVPIVSADATSHHAPAPSTPLSQREICSSSVIHPQSGNSKILRFSAAEIPAPDFNTALSSPSLVPKAVLKSAIYRSLTRSRAAEPEALLDSSPPRAPGAGSARDRRATVVRANEVFTEIALPSSSPTPVHKLRKSVKAALRKKDKPAAIEPTSSKPAANKLRKVKAPPPDVQDSNSVTVALHEKAELVTLENNASKPAANKPQKRKASPAEDDIEDKDHPALTSVENISPRPAKRARTAAVNHSPSIERPNKSNAENLSSSVSQILRPTLRARKRYHAKGRLSSPVESGDLVLGHQETFVDYDALPSPPRPAGGGLSSPVSATTKKSTPKPKEQPFTVEKLEMTSKVDKKVAKTDKTQKAQKATKTTAVNAHAIRTIDDVAHLAEDEQNAAGPAKATRLLPRARKARAGKDKNQAEVKEGGKTVEDPPKKAPVRTSARVAQRRQSAEQELQSKQDVERNDHTRSTDKSAHEEKGDRAKSSLLDTSSPRSERKSATKEVPSQTALSSDHPDGSRVAKLPDSAKKSNKTPWDTIADQSPKQHEHLPAPKQVVHSFTDRVDVPMADSDITEAVCHFSHEDITLIAPSSPIVNEKKSVKATSPRPVMLKRPQGIEIGTEIKEIQVSSSTVAINSSPVIIKQGVEMIDLTLDSPPRARKGRNDAKSTVVRPPRNAPLPPSSPQEAPEGSSHDHGAETQDIRVQEYLPTVVPPRTAQHTVRFISESIQSSGNRGHEEHGNKPIKMQQQQQLRHAPRPSVTHAQRSIRRRQAEDEDENERTIKNPTYPSDPSMQRIVDVLDGLHQVVLCNLANKFEGVREDARAGRDELLRRAADDLQSLRGESVACYNGLVDLEQEYATYGRNMIHGTEDWIKINRDICRELSSALEMHDRGMLSKKMPATLVDFKL